MQESGRSTVAVIIPTRDRGGQATRTIRTVLAGKLVPDELLLIDQSRDDRTLAALGELLDRAPVRHLPSDTQGISAALNVGVAQTKATLIAITGDDCSATSDWLQSLVAELEANPKVGVMFGNIRPGGPDTESGFHPSYIREARSLARRPRDKHLIGGTSACMALRRDVWEVLGGFDEMLGVGAPFRAAEDADFSMRALQAGFEVLEIPGAEVVHHGFVRWSDRGELIERNWFGTGAALAKPLRQGHWAVLVPLLRLGVRWMLGRSRIARGLGGRPSRIRTAFAFMRGFGVGLTHPVDRTRGSFRGSVRG
jgi:GT2 family glycosyltransferase